MVTARNLSPDDAERLTALYDDYKWWADRTVEEVQRALAETPVVVGVETEGELVAAARVLTDHTYYAKIYDVIVAADRRGEGHGRRLLEAVRNHPELRAVDGLALSCREGLVPFYESVGFERFDREMSVPEGGRERLVRMTYERAE
jgi:GNAT superfamily N-acetyltransferase